MLKRTLLRSCVAAVAFLPACDGNEPLPRLQIAVQGGDDQIGPVAGEPEDPLQVIVTATRGDVPASGEDVTFEIMAGPAGASLDNAIVTTDASGIAGTGISFGPDTGSYIVRASIQDGGRVEFSLRAVLPPTVASVAPGSADVGDTVTVTGTNFSTQPQENRVLFDGFRGVVVTATSTQLTAVVPQCVPSGSTNVVVALGSAASGPFVIDVTGVAAAPLDLAPGEAATQADVSQLGCVQLPAIADGSFLFIPQNATNIANRPTGFQLVGVAGDPILADRGWITLAPPEQLIAAAAGPGDYGAWFEMRLRAREQLITAASLAPADLLAQGTVPQVGEQRDFFVFDKFKQFSDVRAEVMAVGEHAVIYQDVDAPDGGFSTTDFQNFAALFDDPIYETTVNVFGEPSDIDGNGRISILFTPVVNEMTPEGSPGFVAGFFFGHDLTTAGGSNRAEIFYSVVPDPAGQHGDPRALSRILEVVPAILAHEFQHMISFNQRVVERGGSPEALWLSEALAHVAEDILADTFAARGDDEQAVNFTAQNATRAFFYLNKTPDISLISTSGQGSLEERGAGWLFVQWLMSHYGGEDLIRRLTQTTRSSVANVVAETGAAWDDLFSNWSIALWADDADYDYSGTQGPDAPAGFTALLDPLHTMPGINLRQVLDDPDFGFSLAPLLGAFGDFNAKGSLKSASMGYIRLDATGNDRPLSLSYTGSDGLLFDNGAVPKLSILRIE